MSSSNEVKIRLATKADHDIILEGFRKWYWPDEPLSIGFEIKTPSFVEEETFSTIPEKGLSLMAIQSINSNSVDDDGGDDVTEEPLGFLVNGLDYPGLGNELYEKFKNFGCKRMLALIGIMDAIEKKLDIFKKYSTDKSFHFLSIAVAPEHRGKGIGCKLFERGFQMARTLGFKIVSVDCTSVYSIAVAEKCKMECVAELEYIDYKDPDGNQIFKPPAPHTHMKRYIKVL